MKKKYKFLLAPIFSLLIMFCLTQPVRAVFFYCDAEDVRPGTTYHYGNNIGNDGINLTIRTSEAVGGRAYADWENKKIAIVRAGEPNPYSYTEGTTGCTSVEFVLGYSNTVLPQLSTDDPLYVYIDVICGDYTIERNDFYAEPTPPPAPTPTSNAEQVKEVCCHDYVWQTIYPATSTSNGTIGYVCSKCHEYKNVRVKTPIEDKANLLIDNAQPGDTVVIDCGIWCSIPRDLLARIASKPTVTYIFKYTFNGANFEVTIGPNAVIPLNLDWYGPLTMAQLFG